MLKVNDPTTEVNEMAADWAISDALLGGTTSMRAAGKKYLPKMEGESEAGYETRLSVATLLPAFSRTVSVMASKPFSKPLQLGQDVPTQIVEWSEDIDRQGNNLHNFSFGLLYEALGYGLCGVLVDYPKANGVTTLADEKAAGLRPYFVHIKHDQLLGWKSEIRNGARVLTQLRISEEAEIPDGDWGTKEVNRVRVLEPGKWALYEEQEAKGKREYVLIDEGVTTLKAIPFIPFYGNKECFMEGRSPLIEIAHLNVQHWQDSSDQQKSVRFARVRIAAIIGGEVEGNVSVGADHFMQLPQGADVKVVQGSAESVKIGREELTNLESQMIQMGAELLIQRPNGQRTATESNNDAEANRSDLQRIAEGVADGIDQCLQFMADWVNLPSGGHVTMFSDYGAGNLSDASAQLVLSMQQGGLLSKPTTLKEMQRRNVLSPDLKPETELSEIENEGPKLGNIV